MEHKGLAEWKKVGKSRGIFKYDGQEKHYVIKFLRKSIKKSLDVYYLKYLCYATTVIPISNLFVSKQKV